jgi:hypothetical protein
MAVVVMSMHWPIEFESQHMETGEPSGKLFLLVASVLPIRLFKAWEDGYVGGYTVEQMWRCSS